MHAPPVDDLASRTPPAGVDALGPLTGFTIGVTAHRRAEEQIELLQRKGATVIHGPSIQTRPLAAEAALAEATHAVVADPPDFTLLSTGIGVRAWFEAAESLGLADALSEALAQSTVIARGPKAHGAAVTYGLDVAWQTPNGWASEMIDHLRDIGVHGSRIAVQLDGASGRPLADAVASIGAVPIAVPVYEWSMPTDPTEAERLVHAIVAGRVDAVTFTARPQVENLLTIADRLGCRDALTTAFAGPTEVICVGPVCASALTDLGLPTPVQPARFRLGAMVLAVATSFAPRRAIVDLGGHRLVVQGRAVVVDDLPPVFLTEKERDVFDSLARRPGVVCSKEQLLREVWHGSESDQHVVEVTVGRLRHRLGPAGSGIETVIRRGYRLSPT